MFKYHKYVPGGVFPSKHHGKFEILSSDNQGFLIRFVDTGYTTKVSANSVRSGKVKDRYRPTVRSVGFMGSAKVTDKNRKLYNHWRQMIDRCYSGRMRCYWDCYVVDEWHCFANFLDWAEKTYPWDYTKAIPISLDKDILCQGNRVYGPNTCLWVPRTVNSRDALNRYWHKVEKEKASNQFLG